MRKLFVLVPSLVSTGPIKGAVALCNALVEQCDVTLVALKPSPPFPGTIDTRVRVVRLGEIEGWLGRLRKYRALLRAAGGKSCVASLSYCLSADVFNCFARRHAVTLSSIRGHLLRTYRVDFGLAGWLLAVVHFLIAARLERVIAMTDHMARQFSAITWKEPVVIGNFVDEAQLESFRTFSSLEATGNTAEWRFVFVGRLCPLKCPGLVIEAVRLLTEQGMSCSLDIFGDGPLMNELVAEVRRRGHTKMIRFHGQVDNPWVLAAGAHCLVLPSLTEGISRAALEALYLGVPCVLRDVDSNSELIQSGKNGQLFGGDEALVAVMKRAAHLGRQLASIRPILLGEQFRQASCVRSYFQVVQEL